MENSLEIQKKIEAFGFVEIDGVESIRAAEQLTSHLGPVRPLNGKKIQTISPSSKEMARSASFSRKFGYGRFPLHTDTSFWREPARYVVTYMLEPSGTDTVVLPSALTREIILRYKYLNPIFVRNTVSGINYSPPWFGQESEFIVFDPCYMKPANESAEKFCETLDEYFKYSKQIAWNGSKTLVVDNWKTVHGRQPASHNNRFLRRFYRSSK